MNRRQYLHHAAAGLGATIGGCGSLDRPARRDETSEHTSAEPDADPSTEAPTADERLEAVTFDRVLHAVDDLDMDPSGTELIDDALAEHWTDGTLIEFPAGTYRTARRHAYEVVRRRGIRGLGDSRTDVEFVSPAYGEPDYRDDHLFLDVRSGHGLRLENYTIQQGAEHDGRHSGHIVIVDDDLKVADVELAGFNPIEDGRGATDADPSNHPFVVAVTDRDGIGFVDRYVQRGGGVGDSYPYRRSAILVHDRHRGELQFRDCVIEESGSHSIYGSHHRGCVRVQGGLFKNNDNSNLRISGGGHPTKRSWVRRSTIVIDTDTARHLPDWSDGYDNTKGLEIESTAFPHEDLLVEDVWIHCNSTPSSQGLVRVHDHGSVTFRNVEIRNRVDDVPVFVSYHTVLDPELRFENVTIENRASLDPAEADTNALVVLRDRNGSVITGSCIRASGDDEDGVLLDGSSGVSIVDSTIDVPGRQVTATTEPVDEHLAELDLHDRICGGGSGET